MIRLLPIWALIFSIYTPCFAQNNSKILTPQELKIIETKILGELKKSKLLDNKKKFFITLKAAREFYQYRYYEKAKVYYQQAINIDSDENKSEAYINLITIDILSKDKSKVKLSIEKAQKYYEQNPNFKTSEIAYFLKSIENYLPGKNEVSKEIVNGFYGQFAHDENLINLLKEKKYDSAFSLINPSNLKNSTNDFHIVVYDLLNVYINHKNVKELFCNKQYNEYPNSYAYSTLLCSLLNDYLQTGKFNLKRAKLADQYFNLENVEKKYLYDIAKEIK